MSEVDKLKSLLRQQHAPSDIAAELGLEVDPTWGVLAPGWWATDGHGEEVHYAEAKGAEEAAKQYWDTGDWGPVNQTTMIDVVAYRVAYYAEEPDGVRIDEEVHTFALDPEVPPCSVRRPRGDGHRWWPWRPPRSAHAWRGEKESLRGSGASPCAAPPRRLPAPPHPRSSTGTSSLMSSSDWRALLGRTIRTKWVRIEDPGVRWVDVCLRCGLRRETDTGGCRPDTGERATIVRFLDPEEVG